MVDSLPLGFDGLKMIQMESGNSTAIFVFHFYWPWLLYILA